MSRQNDVGHVLSRAPVLEAVANGSPEGLSKAWAACGVPCLRRIRPFLHDILRVREGGGKSASCRLPVVEINTRR